MGKKLNAIKQRASATKTNMEKLIKKVGHKSKAGAKLINDRKNLINANNRLAVASKKADAVNLEMRAAIKLLKKRHKQAQKEFENNEFKKSWLQLDAMEQAMNQIDMLAKESFKYNGLEEKLLYLIDEYSRADYNIEIYDDDGKGLAD